MHKDRWIDFLSVERSEFNLVGFIIILSGATGLLAIGAFVLPHEINEIFVWIIIYPTISAGALFGRAFRAVDDVGHLGYLSVPAIVLGSIPFLLAGSDRKVLASNGMYCFYIAALAGVTIASWEAALDFSLGGIFALAAERVPIMHGLYGSLLACPLLFIMTWIPLPESRKWEWFDQLKFHLVVKTGLVISICTDHAVSSLCHSFGNIIPWLYL